ncbi:MAG: hypothetical protein Q8Q65_01585 [bacterium]|nr:hypothetical protein [bacterium]
MSLTKKDLQEIGKLITDITSVLNEALESRLKNDIYKFKDEMVERLDRIEQELILTHGQSDRIEDHEERITTLEQPAIN